MSQLLNEENKIIATSPPIIYNTSPFIVMALYQDRHTLSWLHDHYTEPFFYDDQMYQLVKFIPDVVEYEPELIEAIMDLAIKKTAASYFAAKSIIYDHLEKVIHRDEIIDMDSCMKAMILILIEEGGCYL